MIAKALTGFLVLVAVIGALVVGDKVASDPPQVTSATTVAVTPARQDVACPGPLVTPAGATGTDPELGGAATEVTRAAYLTGDVRAVGNGQAANAIVGAAVERVGGGDTAGLASVTCAGPLTDQWIVGGSTAIGASARLVLTNASGSAVEVTITAYGELGELESRQVAVGPNAQQEVLLEGVVVDVATLAVHVTATGAGIVAALQDSRLNGFQPWGTDWATASALATELALPGVGTGGAATEAATVRLVAPEGATAHLALSTPEGAAVWEGVSSLDLEPGVVVEVAVPAISEGTITIRADGPVAAAAIVTKARAATAGVEGDLARDLRWIPGQLAADDNERSAVTVGYSGRVVAYAQRTGTLTLTDPNGATVARAELSAGTSASLPIDVEPGTVLTGSGPYAWVLVTEDGDLISSFAPVRTTIDPQDIVVEQRRYVPEP